MTFVTLPVSANARARTQNNFARWQIRYLFTRRTEWWATMDTLSLREKAALCLRIASRLSWNNPGRLQLTDLAERLAAKQKKSNCKIIRRKRAAWQLRAWSDPSCAGVLPMSPLALRCTASLRARRYSAGFIFRVSPHRLGFRHFLVFDR